VTIRRVKLPQESRPDSVKTQTIQPLTALHHAIVILNWTRPGLLTLLWVSRRLMLPFLSPYYSRSAVSPDCGLDLDHKHQWGIFHSGATAEECWDSLLILPLWVKHLLGSSEWHERCDPIP